jgi:hypothetical protein
MNVERFMVFIIRKGNEFLVGIPYTDTLCERWSISPYDAAQTHRRSTAHKIAKRVGGTVAEFNPITGVVV